MSFSVLPRFGSLTINDDVPRTNCNASSSPSAADSPESTSVTARVRFAKAAEAAELGADQSPSSDESSDDSGLGADMHAANRGNEMVAASHSNSQSNIPAVLRSGTGSAVSSRPTSALGMNTFSSQHV